jgi:hypothetical protein
VVTIMKLSRSYDDFTRKLDQIDYGFNRTLGLSFPEPEEPRGL